ncbi:AraC family transcriptional regulator [Mesorhizobium helmanticense]|uniref:AraC family transcriptional regulator n=1 Tax=Mesorhizobium helmanticense TaxID=1776423 RepID=A0A2T4J1B0_9HYPH|nr:AraC family transcriptional regulator [Mesorhizobium helmanticense]PTE11618.1 AraC family transcriptional regulator [Mesorhizobium helmanticense]
MTAEKSETISQGLAAGPTAAGLAARLAVEELIRHAVDPKPLLARCRLSAAALSRRDRIRVKSQIEFLELASKAVRDHHFGLSLAESVDLRELGILYYVAASSQRLGDALGRLERFVRVGNEALILRIRKGSPCRINVAYAGVSRHLDRHHMEFLTLILLRLCRQLVGQKFSPLGVKFVHHRPSDPPTRKLLGCDVQFGADTDELSLEPALLDLQVVGGDPFLHELMLKNCEDAIRARPSNASAFRTVVENVIAPALPHAEADIKTVARHLGISERTFARRLASEGLTFSEILDGLRRDLAVRYLEQRDLQISQIAWLLGFQQPSALSHACQRWLGTSPLEYRRHRLTQATI